MTTKTAIVEKSEATTEFLSGKLHQVDFERIERELNALWQSAAQYGNDDGQATVIKACAFNLIMYCTDDGADTEASNLLDEITLRHPCRAILVVNKSSGPSTFEAWVSARCHLLGSKKQICCEQITVHAGGIGFDALASLLSPLLISDLPSVMWWRSDGFKEEAVRPFLPFLDEVVLDSARDSDTLSIFSEALKTVQDFPMGKSTGTAPLLDLNWRRLSAWREALALSFQKGFGRLEPDNLSQINSVELKYAAEKDSSIENSRWLTSHQCLLLAGWLMSRLSWQALSATRNTDGELSLKCRAQKGEVVLTVKGVPLKGTTVHDLCAVKINLSDNDKTTVQIKQEPGCPGLTVQKYSEFARAGLAHDAAEKFILSEPPESKIIDLELQSLGGDPVFLDAVGSIVKALGTAAGGKAG